MATSVNKASRKLQLRVGNAHRTWCDARKECNERTLMPSSGFTWSSRSSLATLLIMDVLKAWLVWTGHNQGVSPKGFNISYEGQLGKLNDTINSSSCQLLRRQTEILTKSFLRLTIRTPETSKPRKLVARLTACTSRRTTCRPLTLEACAPSYFLVRVPSGTGTEGKRFCVLNDLDEGNRS